MTAVTDPSVVRSSALPFSEVIAIDFEFYQPDGEVLEPLCMVARELRTGRTIRMWRDELRALSRPPFSIGPDAVMVAYFASAEINCFLELGWSPPKYILDLYVEFRHRTNGLELQKNRMGLLHAMTYFGLDGVDVAEKEEMRALAMRGGSYTPEEQQALIDYCTTDVIALEELLPRMLPDIDVPRALMRGKYMGAVAQMERTAVPIDTRSLRILREHWPDMKEELVRRIDEDFGVFEGITFKHDLFEKYLIDSGIPWPRFLDSGALKLDDDTFKDMARAYPQLNPLRELRAALAQMRENKLQIGSDGRNRTLLSPFSSKTSRNQPKSSKFIFGLATWLRSLIKPPRGHGLAYIDYSQQEFAIAAVLSGDEAMMSAYRTGDAYLGFAVQAGAAPVGATKSAYKDVRNRFKVAALAVLYGAGIGLIASRTGLDEVYARDLLRLHQQLYRDYWRWADSTLNFGSLKGYLETVFGWRVHIVPDPRRGLGPNPCSMVNHPVQATGAEMLRLACILTTDAGIKVCAPVHDALLVEAPLDELEDVVALTRKLMADASEIVLDDFRVGTDAEIICHPGRYSDSRGEKMWETAWQIIRERLG